MNDDSLGWGWQSAVSLLFLPPRAHPLLLPQGLRPTCCEGRGGEFLGQLVPAVPQGEASARRYGRRLLWR